MHRLEVDLNMWLAIVMYIQCTIDIIECSDDNGGCEQTCVNTDGSYYCECLVGHLLDGDNHKCIGK